MFEIEKVLFTQYSQVENLCAKGYIPLSHKSEVEQIKVEVICKIPFFSTRCWQYTALSVDFLKHLLVYLCEVIIKSSNSAANEDMM